MASESGRPHMLDGRDAEHEVNYVVLFISSDAAPLPLHACDNKSRAGSTEPAAWTIESKVSRGLTEVAADEANCQNRSLTQALGCGGVLLQFQALCAQLDLYSRYTRNNNTHSQNLDSESTITVGSARSFVYSGVPE